MADYITRIGGAGLAADVNTSGERLATLDDIPSSGGAKSEIYYALCSTAAATAIKEAVLWDSTQVSSFTMKAGVTVAVEMTYAHTGTSFAQLSIAGVANSTYPIRSGVKLSLPVRPITNTTTLNSRQETWRDNATCLFMFNGTYWVWLNAPRIRKWLSGTTLYLRDD